MPTYPPSIIAAALINHLTAMPGLGTLLQQSGDTLPVQTGEEAAPFEPPRSVDGSALPYLRTQVIPTPASGVDLAGRYIRYGGVFAITLMWPLGLAASAGRDVAGAIVERFRTIDPIVYLGMRIRIRQDVPPDVRGVQYDQDIGLIPIIVNYDVL